MKAKRTSRLIVLNEHDQILLFRIEDPKASDPRNPKRGEASHSFWITPGGSLESGETHEEAARRELLEETGIDCLIGPWVWTGEKQMYVNEVPIELYERYYLIRLSRPKLTFDNLTTEEQAVYRAHKWWTVDEILSSNETIFPLGLGELLIPLVRGNIPSEPIAIST